TFDDLDALDVFWVDVVEAARACAAALSRSSRGRRIHADAVDVDDRIVVQREASHATHAKLRPRADLTGGREDDQPRRSRADELLDAPRGRDLQHVLGL